MKVVALIPAAGEGSRLSLGPKAFVEVGGKSLLERAVAALAPFAQEVVVAVAPGMLTRAAGMLADRARLVPGGASRQESVYALLSVAEADLVLVHDAARPFVPAAVLQGLVEVAGRTGAATAALPVADSLVVAATGETLDRSRVRAIQTPQAFRRDLALEAHERARAQTLAATDDASLVRALGHEVALVPGSPWLMKVTTTEDLALAEALAAVWDLGPAAHARA